MAEDAVGEYDVVIEAAGTNESMKQAVRAAVAGGTVVMLTT